MNDLQLHVVQSDYLRIGTAWDARNVHSSFWRLYINNRDGAAIQTNEGIYPLPGGRIHLIPAYLRFSCQNQQQIMHFYVHFDLLGMTPLLQKALFPVPLSVSVGPLSREVLRTHAAGGSIVSSPALLCRTQSLILHSFAQIIEQLPSSQKQQLSNSLAASNPVRAAVQLVEQRLPMRISVAEMADLCGMSDDHFIRIFRRTIGQTPANYVLERRLTMAARQLLYGTDSIEMIAEEHGFANRFHFTRAFTRAMGVSPAAYRASARV